MARTKPITLGTRLRRLRQSRGMSLTSLANETGFTTEFLEELELGSAKAPVAALITLSRALEVDSGEFLRDDEAVKAEKRRIETTQKRTDHYSYQVLNPDSAHKHLKGFMITIEPNTDLRGPGFQHEGEEFHYVLQGNLEVKVGENLNLLKAGESLHFNSSLVHTLRNTGEEICKVLVILYTP
jgi:transcriptional regulator with XRE-family HTH domain